MRQILTSDGFVEIETPSLRFFLHGEHQKKIATVGVIFSVDIIALLMFGTILKWIWGVEILCWK